LTCIQDDVDGCYGILIGIVLIKQMMSKMIRKGEQTPFPCDVKPMLCTLVENPFKKKGWLFEIKWEGYRIVACKHRNKVILRSRCGLDYTDRYPKVINTLRKIKSDFVIDGEVVAFDENGKINFDAVQKANHNAPVAYYVFDLLWVNGYSIMQLTLIDRKRLLKSMISSQGVLKFSDHFNDGIALYEQAQELLLEGIIAKKENSVYQPDKRGASWLKIPIARC